MKKIISILVLGALPVLAMADGGHQHEPPAPAKNGMSQESHDVDVGQPGDSSNISRTIEVMMEDTMRFTPAQFDFQQGETVRFVIRNNGRIPHEMVIGSMSELLEHAEMMRANPTMQHAEPNMVTLGPGESGEIVWQFGRPGTVDVACLVPGHLEAGMKGEIAIH